VPITPELRAYTIGLIAEVRALLVSGQMPPPVDDRSLCQACSLLDSCQPELVGSRGRIRRLHDSLFIADEDEGV
jgi:CRISPR-associated exonuclease Cas4